MTGYIDSKLADEFCYNYENIHEESEGISASGLMYTKYINVTLYSNFGEGKYLNPTISFDDIIDFDELEDFQILCFNVDINITESLYTLQIFSNKSLEKSLNIFEPQYNGFFYSYKIEPSKKFAIISKSIQNFENILYSFVTYGPAQLYVTECNNYPLCSLDNFNESLSAITIGKTSFINLKKDDIYDFSPINRNQKLYVVECDENAKMNCKFLSLINRDNKEISLEFMNYITRNTLKSQIDKYKISYSSYLMMRFEFDLLVEINILSGDVDILLDLLKEIEYKKDINLNKISLKIKLKKNNIYGSLIFSVKSLDNSLYTINLFPDLEIFGIFSRNIYLIYGFPRLYSLFKEEMDTVDIIINYENYNEKLNLNITRLYSLFKEEMDTVDIIINYENYNEKLNLNITKAVNFNSLNCEIEISEIINQNTNISLKKNGRFFHSSPSFIDFPFDAYQVKLINYDY